MSLISSGEEWSATTCAPVRSSSLRQCSLNSLSSFKFSVFSAYGFSAHPSPYSFECFSGFCFCRATLHETAFSFFSTSEQTQRYGTGHPRTVHSRLGKGSASTRLPWGIPHVHEKKLQLSANSSSEYPW